MNANDVMREILCREHLSAEKASIRMGRSKTYVNKLLSTKTDPKSETLAEFCEAMGYELIARSREDGFEFIIGE